MNTLFCVMGSAESTPTSLAAMASQAKSPRAFRLAGGCSGMTPEQRAAVVPYFVEALRGFDGVAISGGTMSPDGQPMVTNVPSALVSAGNPCVAIGTLPRTHDMSLPKSGSVSVSKYGDTIDLGQHGVAVVQLNASEVLDWDGDLPFYLSFMTGLRNDAQYTVATIVFNGGGVTKKEMIGAIENGIPLIVVRGSGRAADEFATQYDGGAGSFDPGFIATAKSSGLVRFAEFSDPETLRATATEVGLLTASAPACC